MEILIGGSPVVMCLKIIAVNGIVAAKPGLCLIGSQPEKSAIFDLRVTDESYACAYQVVWHFIQKDRHVLGIKHV